MHEGAPSKHTGVFVMEDGYMWQKRPDYCARTKTSGGGGAYRMRQHVKGVQCALLLVAALASSGALECRPNFPHFICNTPFSGLKHQKGGVRVAFLRHSLRLRGGGGVEAEMSGLIPPESQIQKVHTRTHTHTHTLTHAHVYTYLLSHIHTCRCWRVRVNTRGACQRGCCVRCAMAVWVWRS
jgi:hypothetical protein